MNSISSLFLFLTIVFLAKNIECENDIHFELSVQYFSEDCNWDVDHWHPTCKKQDIPWVISDFLPQLNNATNSTCSESDWNIVSQVSPIFHRVESTEWNDKNWHILPDSDKVLKNRYEEFKSCISGIEAVNSPSKYLTQPSILHSKYNISDILRQGNITPGNNYTYQEISDAVSKVTHGKKPIIKCLWNHHLNTLALDQITLFFDESLKLIDPLQYYYLGKCSPDFPILYLSEGLDARLALGRVIYEDPLEKYPTLREDDNGYYIFRQKYEPAWCNQLTNKCNKLNYPWSIKSFFFGFKDNVEFTCFEYGDDPRHSEEFNMTSLSDIQNDILEKWGQNREYSVLFGSVEQNIGRCTTYFKGIDTELKYYKKSLELFDKYNIDAILRQSNITPGKNYTYQEISDAVSTRIDGKTAIIECGHIDQYDQSPGNLNEIKFYLDKNLNPVDHTDIDNPFQLQDSCKHDQLIYYQDTQDYIDE
ncbi:GSCOCG00013667001-RA-CDS, partial [Cotesia congregata]